MLPNALDSIAASVLPPLVEWEILVVDNNSTDQTRGVVNEFCRRYPGRFRYVLEPQGGLSYARNTGIREARGHILAFTDDDVVVETSWLENLTQSLHNGNWAGAGGRTLPLLTVPLPRWLALDNRFSMGGTLCAYFNLGDEPCELDRPPFGANMAFRRRVFEKYGGFRTDLGASPNREIPGCNEDTEFGRRLLTGGEHLRYEPFALVRHWVTEERLRKNYFLKWYFDLGRACIREIGLRPDWWIVPRLYLTMLGSILLRAPQGMLVWMLGWTAQQRFHGKAQVWKTAGEVTEIYMQCFQTVSQRDSKFEN
jgi:glycosyltransferase involved in cell wall biosynthesis